MSFKLLTTKQHQNGVLIRLLERDTWLTLLSFGYRSQLIFRGIGSDISQLAFKRPVDSPTSRWNITRYLPTTTRGLTKNSKNFQAPLRQVRPHIVSDPLEYWHLTPVFWSGHIMLLTNGIMSYSKPNGSHSFGLRTKKGLTPVNRKLRYGRLRLSR